MIFIPNLTPSFTLEPSDIPLADIKTLPIRSDLNVVIDDFSSETIENVSTSPYICVNDEGLLTHSEGSVIPGGSFVITDRVDKNGNMYFSRAEFPELLPLDCKFRVFTMSGDEYKKPILIEPVLVDGSQRLYRHRIHSTEIYETVKIIYQGVTYVLKLEPFFHRYNESPPVPYGYYYVNPAKNLIDSSIYIPPSLDTRTPINGTFVLKKRIGDQEFYSGYIRSLVLNSASATQDELDTEFFGEYCIVAHDVTEFAQEYFDEFLGHSGGWDDDDDDDPIPTASYDVISVDESVTYVIENNRLLARTNLDTGRLPDGARVLDRLFQPTKIQFLIGVPQSTDHNILVLSYTPIMTTVDTNEWTQVGEFEHTGSFNIFHNSYSPSSFSIRIINDSGEILSTFPDTTDPKLTRYSYTTDGIFTVQIKSHNWIKKISPRIGVKPLDRNSIHIHKYPQTHHENWGLKIAKGAFSKRGIYDGQYVDFIYSTAHLDISSDHITHVSNKKGYFLTPNSFLTVDTPLIEVTDVLVNGVTVPIHSFDSIQGIVNIGSRITPRDEIRVDYAYLDQFFCYRGYHTKSHNETWGNFDLNPLGGHVSEDFHFGFARNKNSLNFVYKSLYIFLSPIYCVSESGITNLGSPFATEFMSSSFTSNLLTNQSALYHSLSPTPRKPYDVNIGRVILKPSSSIADVSIKDVRTRGGGVNRRSFEQAIWDDTSIDGILYQKQGVVVYEVNPEIVDETEVKAEASNQLPFGFLPVTIEKGE